MSKGSPFQDRVDKVLDELLKRDADLVEGHLQTRAKEIAGQECAKKPREHKSEQTVEKRPQNSRRRVCSCRASAA